jgi:hypothetical protein
VGVVTRIAQEVAASLAGRSPIVVLVVLATLFRALVLLFGTILLAALPGLRWPWLAARAY